MKKIGLFQVGYEVVNITRLRNLMNSVDDSFNFQEATTILNLGDPDLHGYAYSDKAILSVATPHKDDCDICV